MRCDPIVNGNFSPLLTKNLRVKCILRNSKCVHVVCGEDKYFCIQVYDS